MPWPRYVTMPFNIIRGGAQNVTDASVLYGPYNTLLGYLFPPQDGYVISPQYKRPSSHESTDFTTLFIVESTSTSTVVFYVEVKPPGHFALMSKCADADAQMRDRVVAFIDGLQLPVLNGVSALGLRLAFYKYVASTRVLTPRRIFADPDVVNDTAPQERWSVDLLADEGFERMVALADEMKEMVRALCPESAGVQCALAEREPSVSVDGG